MAHTRPDDYYSTQWKAIKKELKANFYAPFNRKNQKFKNIEKETIVRQHNNPLDNSYAKLEYFKIDSTTPQILNIKNSSRNSSTHDNAFAKFLQFYQKVNNDNFSQDQINEFSCALLVANQHHLYDVFSRPETNPQGLLNYIFKKIRYQCDQKKEAVDKAISTFIKKQFENIRHVRTARTIRNRLLPCDHFSQEWLDKLNLPELKLTKESFDIIKVDIELCTNKRNTHKNSKTVPLTKLPLPKEYKVVGKKNTVVVDKSNNTILALVIKNAINKDTLDKIRKKIPAVKGNSSFWNNAMRDRTGEEKTNSLSAHFGAMYKSSFPTKYSQNTLSVHGAEIFPHLKTLGKEIGSIYQKVLPTTYESAQESIDCYKQSGIPFLADNVPYTTITMNRRAAFKWHRDENAHHVSSMAIITMDEKTPTTTTLFLEWLVDNNNSQSNHNSSAIEIDSGKNAIALETKESSKNKQPLGFILNDGDLLIADTDYVHCVVPETHKTDRLSLVYYTFGSLLVSPQLAAADSDLEDDDYFEAKKERGQKRLRDVDALESKINGQESLDLPFCSQEFSGDELPKKKMRTMQVDPNQPALNFSLTMFKKPEPLIAYQDYSSIPTIVLVDKEDSLTYGHLFSSKKSKTKKSAQVTNGIDLNNGETQLMKM